MAFQSRGAMKKVMPGLFFLALLSSTHSLAKSIIYTNNDSDSINYNVEAADVQLIPGTGQSGENTVRAVKYDHMLIPRFDADLGTLTGVKVEFSGTGSSKHSRAGLCETLNGGFACTFSIESQSQTQFGFNIEGYDGGGPDPILIGGVPAFPTADFWVTQNWTSKQSWLGATIGNLESSTSGPLSNIRNLDSSFFPFYTQGGTFKIFTEILSQTKVILDCDVAILAACQGATTTTHDYTFNTTVTFTFTPFEAISFFLNNTGNWQTEWENSVGRKISYFPTTAANIEKADEVTSSLNPNTNVGNKLTFSKDASGVCRGFSVRTLQSGANFTFDDFEDHSVNLPNFDNALSVGDIDDHENDDFEISFPSSEPPAYAVSFSVRDSHGTAIESVNVYDRDGKIIDRIGNGQFSGNVTETFSFIAEKPIGKIVFDEGSNGDDIALADLAFDHAEFNDSDEDGLNDCIDPEPLIAQAPVEDQIPLSPWALVILGIIISLTGRSVSTCKRNK